MGPLEKNMVHETLILHKIQQSDHQMYVAQPKMKTELPYTCTLHIKQFRPISEISLL